MSHLHNLFLATPHFRERVSRGSIHSRGKFNLPKSINSSNERNTVARKRNAQQVGTPTLLFCGAAKADFSGLSDVSSEVLPTIRKLMAIRTFIRISVDAEFLIGASMIWNGFERTMLSRIRRQPLATQFFHACGWLILAQKLRGLSQAEARLRRRREVYLCRSVDPAG